jgi:hypothetical protein
VTWVKTWVLWSWHGQESLGAQAIGLAAIQQGYRVIYRETHTLLNDLADATLDGTRKQHMTLLATVPLLIIDDLGMRKLPPTAAEELLEIVMRRYERTSTLLTSNRPVDDWGKLLGDTAAVTAMLDRLLHHGHVLKCGPRSWRTKTQLSDPQPDKNWERRKQPCGKCPSYGNRYGTPFGNFFLMIPTAGWKARNAFHTYRQAPESINKSGTTRD